MLTLKVNPRHLSELRAKLVKGRVTRDPVRDLLEAAGSLAIDRVQKYAPRRTGSLAGSFQKQRVQRGDTAAVKVFSNYTVGGFRLAYALDYAKKRYHYRSSGPRGRNTTGYLRIKTLRDVRKATRRLMTQTGRTIENVWARKVA